MASQKEMYMAKWTEPSVNEFISLLVIEVQKGNRTTSTYNKTGWNNIRAEFNKRTGLQFTLVQIKNRVNKLRRQFVSFKKLLSQSGFGWDHINKTVAVEEESVWEAHIKDNKEWAEFRKDGFPQYPDLCVVFGDTFATGEHAVGNAELVSSSDGDEIDGFGFVSLGGDDVIGGPTDLDDQPEDEGLFTPDVTTSATKRRKYNVDRTPNAKRRRKSKATEYDMTCKAIRDLLSSRTSHLTSASVSSTSPSQSTSSINPYSVGAVMGILNGMIELDQDLYNKVVKESLNNPPWREAFILALPERRHGLIEII